jgi:hypothetical protein
MKKRSRVRSPNGPNNGQPKDTHIDNLLQQTLKDDLPLDAEIVMKKQLERFQTKMEQVETDSTRKDSKASRGIFHLRGVRWANFLLRKEVLVVVSLLMIVVGGFIHSSGSSNKLAENLSVLGTSVVVTSQMSQSQSMECSIQVYGENEKILGYSIQWVSPNLSKIQVADSDNTLLKTIWLSEKDIVITDHVSDTIRKERRPAQLSDPLIRPIIGYLAPTELAERMYGEWKLEQYQRHVECGQGIFKVALPNERAMLEVTVDLCTYLPITIKKFLVPKEHGKGKVIMDIKYTWNVPLSPEGFPPKPTKESQKA